MNKKLYLQSFLQNLEVIWEQISLKEIWMFFIFVFHWHRITFIKKKRKIKKIAGQVTTADDSPSGILTHYFASQIRPPLEFSQIRRCDTARKLYRWEHGSSSARRKHNRWKHWFLTVLLYILWSIGVNHNIYNIYL